MKNNTKFLIAILGLGTVLRLLWIYFVNTQPIQDYKHYHDLAMSILQHGRYWLPEGLDYIKHNTPFIQQGVHYPTAFRPPGYPLILALIYFFWPNILAAKLANVVFSIIWMISTYFLVKKYMGERVALWATFVTAIFPLAIGYTSVIGTEVPATALLLGILCLQTYRVGGRIIGPLVLGILIALLSLVKPYFAVFPVLFALFHWWQEKRSADQTPVTRAKTVLKATAIVIVMMAVTISPWTIRNYEVFHRFVPISTNGDFVLYINNNDLNKGMYMDAMLVPNSIFKTNQILDANGQYNEADAMKLAKSEATHWILAHPSEFIGLARDRLSNSYVNAGKDIREWAIDTATLRFCNWLVTPLVQLSQATSLFVIGSGVLYLIMITYLFLRRIALNPLHKINMIMLLFLNLVIFASEGQPRYIFPMYPFFIIGMCWMAAQVYNAVKQESNVDSFE